MTNGEKIQAAFPDIEIWGESKDTLDYSLGGMIHRVTKSWWNAEYKEPTTKTCKTCRNFGSHNGVCDICNNYCCFTESSISEIPTGSNNLSSELDKTRRELEKEQEYSRW